MLAKLNLLSIPIEIILLILPSVVIAASVAGDWIPPGADSLVRITIVDTAQIRLVRSLNSQSDEQNPDERLRSRSLQGIILGDGFTKSGHHWSGGRINDPGSGKTYRGSFQLIDDDHLELRGYVGLPMFGRSETWTRRNLFESKMDILLGRGGAR